MDYMSFIQNNWYIALIAFVIAYLLGSINTAVIVTKIATKGKKDIREMGSGNAGFTNVLRSVGKVPAIFTIVCDLLKAVVAVLLGGVLFAFINMDTMSPQGITMIGEYLCGFFCILGHSYPVYFGFKGGKGIVTAAGMMLVADWRVFVLILATFLIIFLISKIISLADIICACLFPVYTFLVTFFFDHMGSGRSMAYVLICTAAAFGMGLFVVIKHKDNIKRLLNGEEKKIKAKK
ncbi:MAG: glycerol-3-phosphate 1-O-acyltransferase PlsY [Ruminococcus sp.]